MSELYNPSGSHPAPPAVEVKQHIKTVAASGTPEFLGPKSLRFKNAQFIADKGVSTPNTGTITIQVKDGSGNWIDAYPIEANPDSANGIAYSWPAPNGDGYFDGESFRIKVATNGDGVRLIYS